MKKLLNTLFVLTEDSYLTLDGENVVIRRGDAEAGRFPLHTLEGISTFAYPGASPALMGACACRGVQLSFFTPNGRFLPECAASPTGMSFCAVRSIASPMRRSSIVKLLPI